MSLPTHPVPDPHADPLVASVLRADERAAAGACPDAELLAMYAEREFGGREHSRVETHVHACARCQAMVAALVRAMPDAAAAPGAEVAVATSGGFAAWFAGWRWLVPAAALTAVAVVAVWVGRGPAADVAELGRVTDSVADRDFFVLPSPTPPTPAGNAAAESQDRRTLSRAVPEKAVPPAKPAREARKDGELAVAPPAASLEARQSAAGAAPPAERAAEAQTQAKAAVAADAAVRTETSGLVGGSAARVGAAASGARPVPAEQRAGNEVAQRRESAPSAAFEPPPPSPAAIAPAAPARATDPVFRANLTAASWRVRQGVVERTRDGVAWERVTVPGGVTVIAVAPVSADICWAITADAVFTVTDGGTWMRTARPPAGPLTNVGATSARAATVTAGGARFVTTDGGATWAPAH